MQLSASVVDGASEAIAREELERQLKTLSERKQAVFERTKETDKELLEVRLTEMAVKRRQQQQNEIEQVRQALESSKFENTQLKRKLQDKQVKFVTDASEGDAQKDCKKADENQEQEEILNSIKQKKITLFDRTKIIDEELWEIRREEIAIQERLQQLKVDKREVKQMKHNVERLNIENGNLEELLAKRTKLLDDMTARALESDIKIESLEAELSCMKEKVAVYEQEHEGADDVNVMKEELRIIRQKDVEQSAALRKVENDIQRITSYSKTQQEEKEQALRKVGRLEDEIAALRAISSETQQRQLDEISSFFTEMTQRQQQQEQHQQQRTGKLNRLISLLRTLRKFRSVYFTSSSVVESDNLFVNLNVYRI